MAKHGTIRIPDYEYVERRMRAAELIKQAGLDVLIVNSNEARPLFLGLLAAFRKMRRSYRTYG